MVFPRHSNKSNYELEKKQIMKMYESDEEKTYQEKLYPRVLPNTSTTGTGFTVQFNSSKNEGAMLVLPHGTEKRDLKPIKKLERAVKENAQSWHDFIYRFNVHSNLICRYQFVCADLGRCVDNNSLFVVTGYHKASSWCLASFSREAGNTAGHEHEWESIDSIDGRVSPHDEFDETQCKQATFLRGITITLRDCPTAMLQGGKVQVTTSPQRKNVFSRFWNPEPSEMVILNKYHNAGHTSEGQATDPDVSLHHSNLSVPLHPAVMINKYLLAKFPNADVAITYDAQWMGALEECGGHKKMIKQIHKRFVPAYDAIDAVAYFKSKAEPKFGSYNHQEHVGGDYEQQVNKQHPSHKPHTIRQKSTICTVLSHVFKC
ncbi:hypothetical protein JVT61DRAFT_5142 [Boletus reticuloceps]|uniref:Uncharacterized protein n=1 Tax=Boletus reticuloceps TaxID=495285 RepID=A0A8I2Z0W4_9AGAM|nr:hypothetical protein JVT61DRAFT_5142 [Boletus reticuloceps]